MPMAYFRFSLQSRSELDGLFSVCSSISNSYVSLDFCLEKKASIIVVFFASENLSFLLWFRQLWDIFP